MTPLGKTLKALNLHQEKLATETSINQGTISKLLSGHRAASPKLAAKIIDYLDPDRLLLNELMILYPERYSTWEYPEQPEPSKSQQVVSTT